MIEALTVVFLATVLGAIVALIILFWVLVIVALVDLVGWVWRKAGLSDD